MITQALEKGAKKGNQDNYLSFTELSPKVSMYSPPSMNPTYPLGILFCFHFLWWEMAEPMQYENLVMLEITYRYKIQLKYIFK